MRGSLPKRRRAAGVQGITMARTRGANSSAVVTDRSACSKTRLRPAACIPLTPTSLTQSPASLKIVAKITAAFSKKCSPHKTKIWSTAGSPLCATDDLGVRALGDNGLCNDDLAGDDLAGVDVASDAFGTGCWDDAYAFAVDAAVAGAVAGAVAAAVAVAVAVDEVIDFPYFCGFPPTIISPEISSVIAAPILHEIFINELLNSYCLSIFGKAASALIILLFQLRCMYRAIRQLFFPL